MDLVWRHEDDEYVADWQGFTLVVWERDPPIGGCCFQVQRNDQVLAEHRGLDDPSHACVGAVCWLFGYLGGRGELCPSSPA
jgi:hypothetical protein